ncbi:uncharacterized protein LOC124812178 [Hydra vulgaris]|uniref:uncharacterized protein LOC124812178 n=1 Tax=Hydra vulgaris TaxID=6087 RepID=UPI001F5F69B2|nr:uncharacterized protein LOC124812178 [Hydra vulgaris]
MTKIKIEDWRKSYKRKEKLQTQEKKIFNYEKLLTPEHLSIYLNHEHALNAKRLFDLLTQNPLLVLSQTDFCCIRDYLYIVIGFSTANRSGVISNMTTGEFFKAKEVENLWVISVWDHKTAMDYGPADVMIEDEHYQQLKIFVNFARNKVTSKGFDNVFLSWSGNKMSSGEISDRLNSLFTKVGIRDKSAKARLCFNDLRRSTSTFVRDKKKGFEDVVAEAMNHSKLTTDKHYNVKNRKQSVAMGTKIIRDHYFSENPPSTPKKIWSKDETDFLKKSLLEKGCSSPSLSEIKNSISDYANINASPTQICSKCRSLKRYEGDTIKKLDSSTQQKLYLWERDDLNILVTIGKEFIDGGSVTKKRVETVLGNTPLFSKFNLSQIRTRINYEKTKKKYK